MATPADVVTPALLTDPGYLFVAPLASTLPANTVVGSVFTDAWDAAWLPLGATEDGTTFAYSSEVEALRVAEFFDPVQYRTTDRTGSVAFALASIGAANFKRALNGGAGAVTATSGSGATALYDVEPVTPGSEVRVMIGWESQDHTMRLVCRQTFQGGELSVQASKAPTLGLIACTFNFEKPASSQPFKLSFAGAARA